ncbi:MAG TPA: gluconokinase [Lacunisphaera sp.]|nr:gluconokinase [Lacunisphaera sp.]
MSPRIILLMGVAGSGKTTIGRRLAAELGWPYHEADDFHSAASKDRMARGLPLDDHDRAPWLASIRAAIDDCLAAGRSAVFTCSALKEKYRRVLLQGTSAVSLVHLAGDPTTIRARVSQRPGHYLKADLVQSQFEDLEAPTDALTLDIQQPPGKLIAEIRRRLL